MTHIDGYDDVNVLARFEFGTVLSATDGTDYLLITDESTLADLLGPDEVDLLDQLVHVRRFPTRSTARPSGGIAAVGRWNAAPLSGRPLRAEDAQIEHQKHLPVELQPFASRRFDLTTRTTSAPSKGYRQPEPFRVGRENPTGGDPARPPPRVSRNPQRPGGSAEGSAEL